MFVKFIPRSRGIFDNTSSLYHPYQCYFRGGVDRQDAFGNNLLMRERFGERWRDDEMMEAHEEFDDMRLSQRLMSGSEQAENISVAKLFELADQMQAVDDFAAKKRLYELIAKHPGATDSDRRRIEIHRLDMIRRNGDPKAALEGLTQLDGAAHDLAYLMAAGECKLMLGEVEKSTAIQRQLLGSLEESEAPIKKLYYLGVFLARKLLAGQDDEELAQVFKQYELVLSEIPADYPTRNRAVADLFRYQGRLHELREEWDKASQRFLEQFQILNSASKRQKTVAALEYLYDRLKSGRKIEREEAVLELSDFFARHQGELLAADETALREKLDLVKSRFGI